MNELPAILGNQGRFHSSRCRVGPICPSQYPPHPLRRVQIIVDSDSRVMHEGAGREHDHAAALFRGMPGHPPHSINVLSRIVTERLVRRPLVRMPAELRRLVSYESGNDPEVEDHSGDANTLRHMQKLSSMRGIPRQAVEDDRADTRLPADIPDSPLNAAVHFLISHHPHPCGFLSGDDSRVIGSPIFGPENNGFYC